MSGTLIVATEPSIGVLVLVTVHRARVRAADRPLVGLTKCAALLATGTLIAVWGLVLLTLTALSKQREQGFFNPAPEGPRCRCTMEGSGNYPRRLGIPTRLHDDGSHLTLYDA